MANIIYRLSETAYRLRPSLAERVGPHGETLAAAACGGAVALYLFAPTDWWSSWAWLPLFFLIGLLFYLAAYFLLVAVAHAVRLAKGQQDAVEKEQETASKKVYQVTRTRVRVMREAGVPDDIAGVVDDMLKNLPIGTPAALPHSPLPKEKFLKWLAQEVGLGRTRVGEFKDTILKYAECDPDDAPAEQPRQQSPIGKTAQVVPNGVNAVSN